MKMQRFALALLVLNVVLLALFSTQQRASAAQAIEPILADGRQRVITP